MIGKRATYNVAVLASTTAVLLFCPCLLAHAAGGSSYPKASQKTPQHSSPLTIQQIAAKVSPSVATLTVLGQDGQIAATGSGFVVGKNMIAMNLHVVWGAHSVTANFPGGRSENVPGVILVDADHDLVTLAANTDGIPALPLGETPAVGETVVAVGSPEQLTNSVSSGIISGIRFQDNVKTIQTTAPISPGSSGGPLLNNTGVVVGVTSSHYVEGQNLNFAVPASYIRKIIPKVYVAVQTWDSAEKLIKEWRTGGVTAKSTTDAQSAKSAVDNAKDDAITAIALGNVYYTQGKFDEAIEQYRKSISLDPQASVPHYNLANIFYIQGKLDQALDEYKVAARLNPSDPDAHDKLASLYADIKLYDKAIAEADETIRLNPKYADACIHKGYALSQTENYQDAELAFRAAIRWDNTLPMAYINLGLVLGALGRRAEARQQWMHVLVLGNDKAAKQANELLSKYEEAP